MPQLLRDGVCFCAIRTTLFDSWRNPRFCKYSLATVEYTGSWRCMGTDRTHENCRTKWLPITSDWRRHDVLSKFFVNDIVACYVPCAGVRDKSPDNVANPAEFTRIFFSLGKKNLTHLNRATSSHDLHGDKLRTFARYSVTSYLCAGQACFKSEVEREKRRAVPLKKLSRRTFSNFRIFAFRLARRL